MDKITFKGIKLTKEASDRARRVLLLMQIACIVVFMAAWHELPESWTYARIRAAQAAVWFLDCSSDQHPEYSQPEQPVTNVERSRHDECHSLADSVKANPFPLGSFSNCTRTPKAPFCQGEIDHARELIARRLVTPDEARQHLASLHNSFVDRTMKVTVPFLGITLDVNDLGLLGGITFSLLLTWLLFSLRRETENLRILFDQSPDEALASVYQLLWMTQVLTIPAEHKQDRRRAFIFLRFILEHLEFLLFITPCIVQGFVVWNDKGTLPMGTVLNDQLAVREFHWEVILLSIMGILTLFCFRKAVHANQYWKSAYQRLAELREKRARAAAIVD